MRSKETPWQTWLLVPLTMFVLALGGFVCSEVATKSEVESVRREVAAVKDDVRLILEHLLGSRASSE